MCFLDFARFLRCFSFLVLKITDKISKHFFVYKKLMLSSISSSRSRRGDSFSPILVQIGAMATHFVTKTVCFLNYFYLNLINSPIFEPPGSPFNHLPRPWDPQNRNPCEKSLWKIIISWARNEKTTQQQQASVVHKVLSLHRTQGVP